MVTRVRRFIGSLRRTFQPAVESVRAPFADTLVRGLLDLRFLGFATGLFCSFGFSIVVAPVLDVGQRSCFAHWAYGVGEAIALTQHRAFGNDLLSQLLAT